MVEYYIEVCELPVADLFRIIDDEHAARDGVARAGERVDALRDEHVDLEVLFVPLVLGNGVAAGQTAQRHVVDQVAARQVEHGRHRLLDEEWTALDALQVRHPGTVLERSVLNVQKVDLHKSGV